jgi:Viral BACON domain
MAVCVLVPGAAFAQALGNGANASGVIATAGQVDSWTFAATTGDAIALSMAEVGADSAFVPWIRLLRPDGTIVGNASSGLVAQINVTANQTGTYTVLAASNDAGNDDLGSYVLTLAKTPGAFVVPAGDQGGPMTVGITHTGSIVRGDLDQWTFLASAGDAVTVSIARVSPDTAFVPWIRLRKPDGAEEAFADGGLTAQIGVTLPVSGLYTVLVGSNDEGNDGAGDYTLRVTGASGTALPVMTLDKVKLRFGAVNTGGNFQFQTSPQIVRLTQAGSGTVNWTATSNQPWLIVSPSSGRGTANLTVRVTPGAGVPLVGTAGGAITMTYTGAANAPGPVNVFLTTYAPGTNGPGFGVVDTPLNNRTGVTGAIPFTGWALDDIEIARVVVCRDGIAGEPAPRDPSCGGNAQFYVADAIFIDGARPDVAVAYEPYPKFTVAGWGVMVLTNYLPNQGNGTFRFTMYAIDREGFFTTLPLADGTNTTTVLTMSCDNAHAILPFGTIDTPNQGETISGSAYVNFGWALTQNPKVIPKDGSTLMAYIDGVPIGRPTYNNYRVDIATLFPGLQNSDGAVGFRVIDTTALENGRHTIVWTATDSGGFTEGLGSRFFTASNGESGLSAATAAWPAADPDPGTVAALPIEAAPVAARRGWDPDAAWRSDPATSAGRTVLRGEEIDRFELQLGDPAGGRYTGYLRVGATLTPLPIGSRLDGATGAFIWSPGVGFIGRYDLVFVRWVGTRAVSRQEVQIVLYPKGRGAVGPQIVIDTPSAQQDVGQPFVLAGWAADLDAGGGTGIDVLHVWAYPLTGGAPVFLGTASPDGARPDVAAMHGEQFRDAGYGLLVQGLDPGNYDLAVFAWSRARATFLPASVVRVTVQ